MIMKSKLFLLSLLVVVCWVGMRSLCHGKSNERLPLVSAVLQELGVQHENSLEGINAACQKNLLRKPGVERWQIESAFEEKRPVLMTYLEKLGMRHEIKPSADLGAYDYVVFLGATTERTHDRISYIAPALKLLPAEKRPFVVLLTGMRPLDHAHEDMSYGATESAMMEAVYRSLGLAEIPYIVINAPMKGNARPTTDDTVHAWLATNPKPGRCLIVSNQPFVQRQADVLRAMLPAGFTVEACGPAAKDDCTMAVYLDELARTVYQAKLVAEKNK
jgi:hypothetical protein